LLQKWWRRYRQLRRLDARLLADVGLAELDRHIECGKWFWQR
jgi:uncharacterized protein YjiS (DUF1127 family)